MTDYYCRTCRRACTRYDGVGALDKLIHTYELRGEVADHPVRRVRLEDLENPIPECDFCSGSGVKWRYTCADQRTTGRIVTSRTVGLGDYHSKHNAARSRGVTTTQAPINTWGATWAACGECSPFIDAGDMMGLISHVVERMPKKLTRGKKLVYVRGSLIDFYGNFFKTLKPGKEAVDGPERDPEDSAQL